MSLTLDSKIEFKHLCEFFERITKAKGLKKVEELKRFTRNCRELGKKIKAEHADADVSLFPIFRLILPKLERERGPYGLKSKSLSLLYIKVFCLGKDSPSAKQLTCYRQPIQKGPVNQSHDDLAERVYWLLRPRLSTSTGKLTVRQINEFLDGVAERHASNQPRNELFNHLTRQISAMELKWLTRLLLKELRLGIAQSRVLEVIHPRAEEQFNLSSSLRRVCESLAEGLGLGPSVELFSHVKPMLLERLGIERVKRVLFADEETCRYYVQTKFDGERSQLHMRDGQYRYFTRQGYDITSNPGYGERADSGGILTTGIAPLLNDSCRSIILDGELMGWHKQRRSFGCKGLNYDVKHLSESSYHQPCFVAYDLLLYNDESLIDRPYSERLKLLSSAFKDKEGVLVHCKTTTVTKIEQLMEIFNTALDNDDEGIVVKKTDCLYKPNVRERSGCYKIKAEYSDGLVQDLDLIILGGYYGQGRCSGQIGSFMVGVASPPTNKNGLPSKFYAVVSVKSGLSDEDLKYIHQQLKPHWRDIKPPGVFGPKSQPPNVWITPKQSIVLQLRATEIIRTQSYEFGYSLRFPRVLKVRKDKPWHDACSTTEFMSLVKENKGSVQKLTKRKVTAEDIDDAIEEEKPKIRKTGPVASKIFESFIFSTNDENVVRISRLFEGKEFCVINGNDELSKSDVEKVLMQHMGKLVPNPGNDTFCILVGNAETLRARNIIQGGKYDVANFAWLKRAIKPENFSRISDFYPWELFSMSPKTKLRLDELYDEFMDHYFEETQEEELKRSMNRAKDVITDEMEFLIEDMSKVDKLLFQNEISPYSIFRGITGYFCNTNDANKYVFLFLSGKVLEELNSDVTYIFMDDNDITKSLQEKNKYQNITDGEKTVKILKSQYISACFQNQKLLPLDNYLFFLD